MLLDDLKNEWKSKIIAREKLSEFTGGVLNSRHIANLDSAGRGIPGKMRCGKKIYYPIENVIAFIKSRTKPY